MVKLPKAKENCVSCHNDPNGGQRGAESGHYLQNDNAQAAASKLTFNSMSYNPDTKTVTANMTVTNGDTVVTLAQIDLVHTNMADTPVLSYSTVLLLTTSQLTIKKLAMISLLRAQMVLSTLPSAMASLKLPK